MASKVRVRQKLNPFFTFHDITSFLKPHQVAKREIQSDGGYPKFPPENEELGRAQFSTKDIPVAPRHKRMDYAQALEQAQSMFSKVKEMYSSMQGSSAGGESDTEGDNLGELSGYVEQSG